MSRRPCSPLVAAVLLTVSIAACSGAARTTPPVTTPTVAPPAALPAVQSPPATPVLRPDPVQDLIALSQSHFDAGQGELQMGHLDKAKIEFNLALDVILESPVGARADARLREHFDRLVDRISAYELRALAEGDGFAERPSVPASLDELLALSTFDLPPPEAALRDTVENDLRSTAHDVPIPLNAKVLSYIDLFQGRLREWFQISLQRGQPYIPMIQSALRAQALPLDLAYVPIVESAFRTDALSRAKAKGFWQLMRGTAVENGLKYDWYIDERSNPEKATAAAVKYLKVLNGMFNGDWHLTLASYNGGPGTMQSAIRRRGSNDFWTIAEKGRYLPRETKEYVPMVLAAIVIARNPVQYGFTLDPVEPVTADTVTVPGPVDLRRVAEWTGVPLDEVQRLNPDLRRWTTPVRSQDFTLRVPVGTAAAVQQKLAETPAEELTALQWYTVRRGETLQSVANKLKVRRTDLAEANYLGQRAGVRPGQKLVIPRPPTTLLAARTDRPEPVVATAPSAVPDAVLVAAGTPASVEPEKVTYQVKPGDTLTSIARQYRTTVAAIRSWNSLKTDLINPGDRLTVYPSRSSGGSSHP
ncbi:MAG: LysM peptidoglycan-binding domain-containing protein [Acidobacteria bacterium]|nr:LysM peptidoglycan-binding domain-containing protein [Acidobacteriota bacterium]